MAKVVKPKKIIVYAVTNSVILCSSGFLPYISVTFVIWIIVNLIGIGMASLLVFVIYKDINIKVTEVNGNKIEAGNSDVIVL